MSTPPRVTMHSAAFLPPRVSSLLARLLLAAGLSLSLASAALAADAAQPAAPGTTDQKTRPSKVPAASDPSVVPPAASPTAPAANTAAIDSLIEGKAPATELTPQILYQFLFAEMAGARGNMALSVAAYVDLAKTTRDPKIAKRAAEVALHARQYDAALEASRIWVEREPDSVPARQMLLTLAAAFGRLDEVAQHLDRALEMEPAENRGPALLRINRLLARVTDKAAVQKLVDESTQPYLALPEAHFARAQAAYGARDNETALREIDYALSQKPDWEFAALFKVLLLQDQPGKVVEMLDRFVRDYPQASDARLSLARALVAERRFDDALAQFKTVLEQQPDNSDVIYATALLSMQAKDYATAEKLFTTLVDKGYPEDGLVRTYLGQLAEERKDPAAAARWYASVPPGAQQILATARAAQLLAKDGRLDEARQMIRQVRPETDADRVQLTLAEAQLLRDANRFEDTYVFLNEALAARPNDPDLLYETALSAERIGKFDVTERLLRQLLAAKPEHAHALNALGYSLADRNIQLDEAQSLIDRALTLQPEDPFILDSKGWVQYRRGEFPAALETLQRAYAKRPDPEIAAHLGEVLWALGRKPDAKKVWSEAAKDNPGNDALADTIKKYQP